MGKRIRAKINARKAVWDAEDEVALFGSLDFCIKHKHTFSFNEENVVGRLRTASDSGDIYTWYQINRKLNHLWQTCGREDSLDKLDIFTKGSRCLGLTEDERKAIKSEVERLETLLKPGTPGKKLSTISICRKTTSTSPSMVKRSQSQPSVYDFPGIDRLTPRVQRYHTRDLAKQMNRKRTSSEGTLREDDTPWKRSRQNRADLQKKIMRTQHSFEDPKGVIKRPVMGNTGDEDSEIKLSSENEDRSVPGVFITKDRGPHEEKHLSLGNEIQQLQGNLPPVSATLERIHSIALRKKDEKIMELGEIVTANKEKLDELQSQIDCIRSAQEKRQEGGGSIELLISNLNLEIRHLKRAKDECRKIGTFTKLAGTYEAARQEMRMETQVPSTRRLMKGVLGGCDDDTTLKIPGPNLTAGLRALLSFGFGIDDQPSFQRDQLESLLSNRPPYFVIETLIEAAVCIWVLESAFPNFAQGPAVLGLLKKYRELIAVQDGPIALRNLDIAAHHALINSAQFHQMVDKEAEQLATSLSQTLAPFFARNAKASEENMFETWDEKDGVWKTRRKRLIAIFKNSLKMKADSVLTPERYKLIQFGPGTIFDAANMDVETNEGAPVNAPADEGSTVEHCLHAAIHAFTRETIKETHSVSEAKIQYNNFTHANVTQIPGDIAATVLVKAVVTLRKKAIEDDHNHKAMYKGNISR